MSNERDFKGVWIPKELWLDTELTLLEKCIFVEIDSLDNENHCIAGNDYFATFCNCSESKVSKAIKKLEELNMIEIMSFDGRHRKIRVVKSTRQGSKKYEAGYEILHSSNIDNKTNNKDNSKELLLQEFEFGKIKQTKQNLYSKCISLIDAKTEDKEIRKLLIEWLNMLLEKYKSRGKTLYQNVFKGKLNTLDEFSKDEWKKVIRYNLQKGYEAFYPIRSTTASQKDKPWEKGVTSRKATKEEKQTEEKWLNEQRAKGIKVDF